MEKKNKINIAKLLLIQVFMCFIGPALWGHWLVKTINIISFQEFLHIITAPISIFANLAYFFISIAVIKIKTKKIECYYIHQTENNYRIARNSMKFIPNFIIISMIPHNLIGPFIGMSMLYFPDLGFFITSSINNSLVIYIGALTATGMSFLFFVPLINLIKKCVEDIGCEIPWNEKARFLTFYKYFAGLSLLSSIGVVLLIGSTILSVTISVSQNSPNFSNELIGKTLFISFVVISGIISNYLSFNGQVKNLSIRRNLRHRR